MLVGLDSPGGITIQTIESVNANFTTDLDTDVITPVSGSSIDVGGRVSLNFDRLSGSALTSGYVNGTLVCTFLTI